MLTVFGDVGVAPDQSLVKGAGVVRAGLLALAGRGVLGHRGLHRS
jgi:hypothetical protein